MITIDREQNIGYLIVNVTTARGAIPLENASVTVSDTQTDGIPVVTVASTDSSGKTPRLALQAPDRGISMQPGTAKPYASYLVEIEKAGYYPVADCNVPIFAGITSIQPVEMIPLAENDSDNVYPRSGLITSEGENPDLRG